MFWGKQKAVERSGNSATEAMFWGKQKAAVTVQQRQCSGGNKRTRRSGNSATEAIFWRKTKGRGKKR
jgi:hypothetical protein